MDTTKLRRIPPPAWALAAFAAQMVVTSKRMPWRRSLATHPTRKSLAKTTTAASYVLAATSATLGIGSISEFVRHKTTLDPTALGTSRELVTDGPNAFTRNPMYVALAGALVAVALRKRSSLALIPAVGYVAVIDRVQIPAEEAGLRSTFGKEFVEYAARVPRWIRIPRKGR